MKAEELLDAASGEDADYYVCERGPHLADSAHTEVERGDLSWFARSAAIA